MITVFYNNSWNIRHWNYILRHYLPMTFAKIMYRHSQYYMIVKFLTFLAVRSPIIVSYLQGPWSGFSRVASILAGQLLIVRNLEKRISCKLFPQQIGPVVRCTYTIFSYVCVFKLRRIRLHMTYTYGGLLYNAIHRFHDSNLLNKKLCMKESIRNKAHQE